MERRGERTSEVGRLAARVGESTHVPVDAGLPSSVKEAVEEVEEHGGKELDAAIVPVNLIVLVGRVHGNLTGSLILLPSVATAPDGKSQKEKNDKRDLGTHTAANAGNIEGVTDHEGAEDLRKPVEQVVEGTSADVELGEVHIDVLVGVEDV